MCDKCRRKNPWESYGYASICLLLLSSGLFSSGRLFLDIGTSLGHRDAAGCAWLTLAIGSLFAAVVCWWRSSVLFRRGMRH